MRINIRKAFSSFKKSVSHGFESIGDRVSAFKSARAELVHEVEKGMPQLTGYRKLGDELPAPHIEKTETGAIRIGETHIDDLEFHLESGRFRKVYTSLGIKNVISEEVEKGLQKEINSAAKKIADLEEEIAKLKKGKMKDYDVPIDEAKEKLSTTQQNKLTEYYNIGLKNAAAVGGVVLVGVAALGIDQLIQECHKAKGCFLFNSDTGEGGRCKLENRSCAYKDHPHRIPQCDSAAMDKLMPNLNLVIRYLKKNKDTPLFRDFKSYLNNNFSAESDIIEPMLKKIEENSITNKDIEDFIQKPGFEEKLNQFCKDNKSSLKFTDFCDLLDEKERTETVCVACNPSAPHNSLQYVNIEDLPDTLRPRCDENPTLWEAFVKICGNTPNDIADALGLTEAWKTIMMWVGVFIGVMVLFIGIGYLVYMFRKKGEDDEVSYSELENENDEDDNHEHHEDEHHKDEKKTEESKV